MFKTNSHRIPAGKRVCLSYLGSWRQRYSPLKVTWCFLSLILAVLFITTIKQLYDIGTYNVQYNNTAIEGEVVEVATTTNNKPAQLSKEESSGRHVLPEDDSNGRCSCGGWQNKWYYKNESTPACCLRQTAETVFSVIDLFERYNISYSPDGGSLIGVVRCGSLLRYEYDFDFHIYNATQPAMKPLFEEWVLKENMKGGVLTRWGVTVGGLKHIRGGWGDFNKRTPKGKKKFGSSTS